MTHSRATLALLAGSLLVAGPAAASPVTFSGSSGSQSASVSFDVSGSNLLVTLTNTSSADTLVPTDLLTAVFFTISGNPALTRVSAVLTGGSVVEHGTTDPGDVVGGEYAYLNGLSQYGANEGISSSGLNIFGAGDLFPGNNLDGPASPDGPQYGLASAGDSPATGNPEILSTPIIMNSVLFTLGGLPQGFLLSSISNVTFQYGTALDEGHFDGSCVDCSAPIPEPGSLALFGSGIILAARGARRRQRRQHGRIKLS
jgi:hypothetical protein